MIDKLKRKPQVVLSLDPGGHTGICLAIKTATDWTIEYTAALARWDLYNYLAKFNAKWETDQQNGVQALVIYETYKLYASHAKAMIGNKFETCEHIGVIKFLAHVHGIPVIEYPASNKTFWSDTRLKYLGLYPKTEHERDAIRHFLHWLYFVEKGASLDDLK